jgi:hypothetical protein
LNDNLASQVINNSPDAVATAAKIMISKIRKHVEQDKCSCCKEALENG